MASKTVDPLGTVSERIRLNAQVTQITATLTAGGLDQNGANDLRLKNAELTFRLNAMTTATVNHLTNMAGTCFNQFGLEIGST